MYPSPQAYDRAITVFSPDGRLFQVEYAREAVKKGAASLAICTENGIVLAAAKTSTSNLVLKESIRKIEEIDQGIGFTSSGLVADAKKISDYVKDLAIEYRQMYNEPPSLIFLVKRTAALFQSYTLFGGARPFGVAILLVGYEEDKPLAYEIDPSGAYTGYLAVAIGSHRKDIEVELEKLYKPNMKLEQSKKLAIDLIKKVSDQDEYKHIEILTMKKHKGEVIKTYEMIDI
jgi:proteasome alpha subunit